MRKKILLIVSALSFTILLQLNNSNAEIIELCLSDSEQYAVIVNSRDDCLEDEKWMKISGGKEIESKKKYTPLVSVSPNKDCDTEGVVRAVGFDENQNGSLDENEIMGTSSDCKIEVQDSIE